MQRQIVPVEIPADLQTDLFERLVREQENGKEPPQLRPLLLVRRLVELAAQRGKADIQRYKGLGEMDADQLWDTTLNPATRMLKRIEIEDGRLANDVTSLLMGSDVPPRKEFIYEHAHDAELDV